MVTNPFLNPHFNFHQSHEKLQRIRLARTFFNLDINQYQQQLKEHDEHYWQTKGEQKALHLFHLAAQHIPAYKKFLTTHHVNHVSIRSFKDYQQVPRTDKANYISQYPLEQLCWHGRLETSNIISFSSGSTGQPYVWPRSSYQDFEGAFAFEHLLTSLYDIAHKTTLFVNCFSMGNYVSGIYIYTSIKLLSQKGYPLTIVSPGINHQDIFNMLSKLDQKYDQVILAGYPPFIRDIIDSGQANGVDFSKVNLKFFFGSEFFSEDWRDYTLSLVHNHHPLTDSTNIYGTADSTIFSFETPAAILIRKLIKSNPEAHQKLFASSLTPTLTQYNPLLTFYETINDELVLTANSGIPLIRYGLKDRGGMLTHQQVETILSGFHIDFQQEIRSHKLHSAHYLLPYVYVTNRIDGAVSFYAIKIFPEYARQGIESAALSSSLSGRFCLVATQNYDQQPELFVHAELNSGVLPDYNLEKQVRHSVTQSLQKQCSEYAFLKQSLGQQADPKIVLHSKGDSDFFQNGIKQKWIKA